MEVKEIKPPGLSVLRNFYHTKKYSLHHIYQGIAKNYFYHRFRWYATLENKTPKETLKKFPPVLYVYLYVYFTYIQIVCMYTKEC